VLKTVLFKHLRFLVEVSSCPTVNQWAKNSEKSTFPLLRRHDHVLLNSAISGSIQLASFRGKYGDSGV
jgi:hypothetical protein